MVHKCLCSQFMQGKLFLFIILPHVLQSRSQLHREGRPLPLLCRSIDIMSLLPVTLPVWHRGWWRNSFIRHNAVKLQSRRSYHVWKSLWMLLEKIGLDSWKEKLFPLLSCVKGSMHHSDKQGPAARLPMFKSQLSTSCVTISKLPNLSVPYLPCLQNEGNHSFPTS